MKIGRMGRERMVRRALRLERLTSASLQGPAGGEDRAIRPAHQKIASETTSGHAKVAK